MGRRGAMRGTPRRGWAPLVLSVMPLVYLALAVTVTALVCRSGTYPAGADTMYHIHRGEVVYRGVRAGNWWPNYDPTWYNGVEILRYWAPLPAYCMAACQALAGGDALYGYLVFVGLLCFLGSLPWLWIGQKRERPLLGAFLGGIWFFMPNNLYALFVEGNLARSLSMIVLPLFLYAVTEYLQTRKWQPRLGMTISFSLMALCHVGYAGMLALAVLLYMLLYAVSAHSVQGCGGVLLSMLLGFGLLGIWLLPSLKGGIANVDSSESMRSFFQSLLITLNPYERVTSRNGNFYFGLAAFLLAVFGLIGGGKETIPGSAAALLLCLASAASLYPLLSMLPGGQYLWMLRFISIALCMLFLSFLQWRSLRKRYVAAFCILLVLDTVPSLSLVYGRRSGELASARFDTVQAYSLADQAQAITVQRLAVLNEGAGGVIDAYLLSDWNRPTRTTFGAGWEAASTAANIVQLNRAANGGDYRYLFDRCKELGSDTVLVRLAVVGDLSASPTGEMDQAAEANGYFLAAYNEDFRLYHQDVEGDWGLISRYRAIAIGETAYRLALTFPALEETGSSNLADYSFEELSGYDIVYLSGFSYDDRAEAEDLLRRLSRSGVRVVIDASSIPEERSLSAQSFLGVRCNTVTFSESYPTLETADGSCDAGFFPQDYASWQTVYLEGLTETLGAVREGDGGLAFYGTADNENLVFLGFDLPTYYFLTEDAAVEPLLAGALGLSSLELPERRVVPLRVEYGANTIRIVSPEDGVNSTIAYHDSFVSDQPLTEKNHLTYVGAGTTDIVVTGLYRWPGGCLSAFSAVGTLLLAYVGRKRTRVRSGVKEHEAGGADSGA